jgi:hypothetical protein
MEPYQPRAFRFIELCRFGKWQMKLYGIACRGEFPRSELLAAAKKIAATELAKFESNDFFTSDLLAHTMDAMLRSSLSISRETRTSFFTGYFFPGVISLLIFLPRAIRTRPSAFEIWHRNYSSVQPGSNMCC